MPCVMFNISYLSYHLRLKDAPEHEETLLTLHRKPSLNPFLWHQPASDSPPREISGRKCHTCPRPRKTAASSLPFHRYSSLVHHHCQSARASLKQGMQHNTTFCASKPELTPQVQAHTSEKTREKQERIRERNIPGTTVPATRLSAAKN